MISKVALNGGDIEYQNDSANSWLYGLLSVLFVVCLSCGVLMSVRPVFAEAIVTRTSNFQLTVLNDPLSDAATPLNAIDPTDIYILEPGAGNVDYFNYFSGIEKFDVSAFHIKNFNDLLSQIPEGKQALQRGSSGISRQSIQFTLQNAHGQVTVLIQHADNALTADNFVYAQEENPFSPTGAP